MKYSDIKSLTLLIGDGSVWALRPEGDRVIELNITDGDKTAEWIDQTDAGTIAKRYTIIPLGKIIKAHVKR